MRAIDKLLSDAAEAESVEDLLGGEPSSGVRAVDELLNEDAPVASQLASIVSRGNVSYDGSKFGEIISREAPQEVPELSTGQPGLRPSSRKLQKEIYDYLSGIEKKISGYLEDAAAGITIEPTEEFNSLTLQGLRDTIPYIAERVPEIVENYNRVVDKFDSDKMIAAATSDAPIAERAAKVADAVPDELFQIAGDNPLTGLGTAVAQEAMQVFADMSPEWKKKYEKASGMKYYTAEEISQMPAEKQDEIRAIQGSIVDKGYHSLGVMWDGVTAILENGWRNATNNWDDKDWRGRFGDVAYSLADMRAAFSPLGVLPYASKVLLDFDTSVRSDPLGTLAVMKSGAAAPAQIVASAKGLKAGGLKGASEFRKIEKQKQQEAVVSLGEFIEEQAVKLTDLNSPALNAFGEQILSTQRGAGRSKAGKVVKGAIAASTPWIFATDRLAGMTPKQKARMKQADKATRAERGKFADRLVEMLEDGKVETFSILKEFVNKNQQIMPETHTVLTEVNAIMNKYAKEQTKIEKALESPEITEQSRKNLFDKLQMNERLQSKLKSAIENVDLKEIDLIRAAELGSKFRKSKQLFDRMKNKKYWEQAAVNAIANAPDSIMSITYKGQPVHPLTFVLENRTKLADLDVRDLGVKMRFDKNASPEAIEFLKQHHAEVTEMMRLTAQQAKELGALKGKDGKPYISEGQMLANIIAGYFPGGKPKKAFGELKDGAVSEKLANVDQALSITMDHLKMARESRKRKPVRSLEDAVEFAKKDMESWQVFTNVINANAYTIERLKMISDLSSGLEKSGRVFDRQPLLPNGKPRPGYTLLESVDRKGNRIEGSKEFGALQDRYVPDAIYDNLIRFDRNWGESLRALQIIQNAFKTAKTTANLPFYQNTAVGLGFLQTIYGGKPQDVITGMKMYLDKNEYYRGLRDEGMILGVDEMIGLETGNRGVLMDLVTRAGRAFKRNKNKEQYGKSYAGLIKFVEDSIETFENPKNVKKLKKAKILKDAAIAGVLMAGYGTVGGPLGSVLGLSQAVALTRGRKLATMLDQGSRVASFKRYIDTQAYAISKAKKIPLKKAIREALQDKEIRRKAAEYALTTNIDYSYVPIGVERISAIVPSFPFVKFAHRAGGAMMAYPFKESARAAALTSAQRTYTHNMDEQDRIEKMYAPLNTAGLTISLDDEYFLNESFSFPLHGNIPLETTAPFNALIGGRGSPVLYGGALLEDRPFPTEFMKGWLEGLDNFRQGKDRYGNNIDSTRENIANLLQTWGPSSIYYVRRMGEAQNMGGKDRKGFRVGDIFANSYGLKVTPKSELDRKIQGIRAAANRRESAIEKEYRTKLRGATTAEQRQKAFREMNAKRNKLIRDLANLTVGGLKTLRSSTKQRGF